MKKGIKRIVTAALAAVLMVTQLPVMNSKAAAGISIYGKAHVQTYGDTNGKIVKENGIDTLVLGTRGQAKRVESMTINLQNESGYTGTIQYRVHRQTYGWTNWLNAGQPAGTTGEAKRLEAIQMRLTGELASHYDIRYQVHIQTYGDNQGWVYNGALAGTTGEAKRLEEVKIQIIPKNTVETAASINYRVHRQTYGWETKWAKDGSVSGTTGQAKRLEAISIDARSSYNGSVEYQTHVQTYGWMDWVSDGALSGTSGQAKRLEAIRIRLTGELAQHYDIYYRVHAQTFGWMGWAKNGESAGTAGYGKRLEAIQIMLVKKGAAAPGATVKGITQTTAKSFNDANASGSTENPGNQSSTKPSTDTSKPTWIAEQTVTVTYYQCDSCNNIYRTEEELEQHFAFWDPKYHVICSCGVNKTGTKRTETFTIRDGYWSNEQVPETHKIVWVATEPAYTETKEIVEMVPYSYCFMCKKRFYKDDIAADGEYISDHTYNHIMNGDPYSNIIDGEKERRVVGTETVTEPEYGYYEVQ
mgnify:FL=1